jgi:hypothetical protein
VKAAEPHYKLQQAMAWSDKNHKPGLSLLEQETSLIAGMSAI